MATWKRCRCGATYTSLPIGANVVVQVAPDGLLVVDTSVAAMSEKVLAAIKIISDKPIRHIIHTSADEHHTSGNENLSNAGRNLNAGIGGPSGREPARLEGAPVIAHELVLHRMSGLKGEAPREPFAVWPPDTVHESQADLFRRRGRRDAAHAGGAHRWRPDRLVPQVGCGLDGRRVLHGDLSDDRPRARRDRAGHPERPQPASSTSPSPRSTIRAARWWSPGTDASATSRMWRNTAT